MKRLINEEMKKVMGGTEPDAPVCFDEDVPCEYYESGTGMVTGYCEQNSKDKCICHGPHSSIVTSDCVE